MTGARDAGCPPVIVVMGITGAGKTTVGRALAEELGRAFHDADDFHPEENVAAMRRGQPLTDRDRGPWLGELRALIARHMADGIPMVLACSALRASYRAGLVPRGVGDGQVAFVHLRLTPELARRRLDGRRDHFMPASLVASQLATLEEPVGGLHVDAARPVPEIVALVRRSVGC